MSYSQPLLLIGQSQLISCIAYFSGPTGYYKNSKDGGNVFYVFHAQFLWFGTSIDTSLF